MPPAGFAFGAERRQQPAFAIELSQHVVAVVGRPDVPVAIDPQAVRHLEQPLAPAADELAVFVERHQRRLAAVQDVDPVLGIDRHRRHRADFDFRREFQKAGGGVGIGGRSAVGNKKPRQQ